MLTKNILELQQSHGGPAVSEGWKLMLGRAISLQPREAGVLRISQGQVWATFDGPHPGHGNESGDLFLQAGQALVVGAGQRLVFEPWGKVGAAPVYFEWTRLPTADTVRASRWNAAVVQPQHAGGRALLMAGRALLRSIGVRIAARA